MEISEEGSRAGARAQRPQLQLSRETARGGKPEPEESALADFFEPGPTEAASRAFAQQALADFEREFGTPSRKAGAA